MNKLTLALVVALTFACGPSRYSPHYGAGYRLSIERQTAMPGAGEKPQAIAGLDPQDAAIIAHTYRTNLGREVTTSTESSPLLFIAPHPQRIDYASDSSQGRTP